MMLHLQEANDEEKVDKKINQRMNKRQTKPSKGQQGKGKVRKSKDIKEVQYVCTEVMHEVWFGTSASNF